MPSRIKRCTGSHRGEAHEISHLDGRIDGMQSCIHEPRLGSKSFLLRATLLQQLQCDVDVNCSWSRQVVSAAFGTVAEFHWPSPDCRSASNRISTIKLSMKRGVIFVIERSGRCRHNDLRQSGLSPSERTAPSSQKALNSGQPLTRSAFATTFFARNCEMIEVRCLRL
jgi:hypothetical protein